MKSINNYTATENAKQITTKIFTECWVNERKTKQKPPIKIILFYKLSTVFETANYVLLLLQL